MGLSREIPHLVASQFISVASPVANGSTNSLHIGEPFYGFGSNLHEFPDAAALVFLVGAWTVGSFNILIEESHNFNGPWTTVDPMFVEWFREGRPGYISAGAWVPDLLGAHVNPLVGITGAALSTDSFMASYPGGLMEFIRGTFVVTGAPTNPIMCLGLLSSLRETAPRAYTNYPNDLAITWPTP